MTDKAQRPMTTLQALERLEWSSIVDVATAADMQLFAQFAIYRVNLCYRGRWAHNLFVGHHSITGGTDDGHGNGVHMVRAVSLNDRQLSAFALLPMQAHGGLARALYREYAGLKDSNHTALADWIREKARMAWEAAERYAETYNAVNGLS